MPQLNATLQVRYILSEISLILVASYLSQANVCAANGNLQFICVSFPAFPIGKIVS
jgi:hypothetical protein